jgi:5-methylcytosine-specific restriction endonuclease McrA
MISPPQAKPAKRQTYRERVLSGNVSRKPRQRIKPVSAKRARENAEYTKLRREFLAANPACLVCKGQATEIHHACGRQGKRLLDVEFFRPLCSGCHRRVHDNPAWAKERGLLVLVTGANDQIHPR